MSNRLTSRITNINTSRGTSKNTTTTFSTTYATAYQADYTTTYLTVYSTAASTASALRSSASSCFFSCNEFCTSTFYFTGGSYPPTAGTSFAYTNSGGTSALSDAWYGISNTFGGAQHQMRTSGGAGGVQVVNVCSGGGGFSDRRHKKNIKLIGKSKKGFNIYSFEFGGTKLGDKAAK